MGLQLLITVVRLSPIDSVECSDSSIMIGHPDEYDSDSKCPPNWRFLHSTDLTLAVKKVTDMQPATNGNWKLQLKLPSGWVAFQALGH